MNKIIANTYRKYENSDEYIKSQDYIKCRCFQVSECFIQNYPLELEGTIIYSNIEKCTETL